MGGWSGSRTDARSHGEFGVYEINVAVCENADRKPLACLLARASRPPGRGARIMSTSCSYSVLTSDIRGFPSLSETLNAAVKGLLFDVTTAQYS